jgi:hypothetical protein
MKEFEAFGKFTQTSELAGVKNAMCKFNTPVHFTKILAVLIFMDAHFRQMEFGALMTQHLGARSTLAKYNHSQVIKSLFYNFSIWDCYFSLFCKIIKKQ